MVFVTSIKPISKIRKAVIGTMIAGVTAGTLWLTFGKGKAIQVPAYQVLRVLDGDTFETTEKQLIRLVNMDAPETGLCGSREAKQALENFILGKAVYIKVLYRDPYHRLISLVYTQEGNINELMIRNGFVYHRQTGTNLNDELGLAAEYARNQKIGIHGFTCTQMVNAKNPKCNIKGNTRGKKIYYTPHCRQYAYTKVQLYLGDQWFCSEKQAQAAGFRKGKQCQ